MAKTSTYVTAPTDHKRGECVSRIISFVGKHTDVTTSKSAMLEFCACVNPKHQVQCDTEICHQPGQTAQVTDINVTSPRKLWLAAPMKCVGAV